MRRASRGTTSKHAQPVWQVDSLSATCEAVWAGPGQPTASLSHNYHTYHTEVRHMGDRVSIAFRNNIRGQQQDSVVLFEHWGGIEAVEFAEQYAEELRAEAQEKGDVLPLYRMEPDTVMVDYIRVRLAGSGVSNSWGRVTGNFYLEGSYKGGDNSDNGHHVIKLYEARTHEPWGACCDGEGGPRPSWMN